jgi:hypothetical protein
MTTIAVSVMQGQAAQLSSEQPYTVTAECWVYHSRQHAANCAVPYKPETMAVSRHLLTLYY